jgi:antitoxin CcdA
MLITEHVNVKQEVVTGFECDCCGAEFPLSDIIEMQEMIPINISGGYGSVFGDGTELSGTFCQNCVKKLIGEYLKEANDDWEPELTEEQANKILEWESSMSWRRVAEEAAKMYPELGVEPGNQLDGRELCFMAIALLKDKE